MAEETEIRRKAFDAKHLNWAAIALALVTSGGGALSSNGVASRLEAVAVTLAEIKGSVQRQDDGRLRLESAVGRLEERVRSLEMGRNPK